MELANAVEPVSALKAHGAKLIRRAQESGQPIILTRNGRAAAVLLGIEGFERERRALLLLKFLAQGERSLKTRGGLPHADVVGHFERKFKARRRG